MKPLQQNAQADGPWMDYQNDMGEEPQADGPWMDYQDDMGDSVSITQKELFSGGKKEEPTKWYPNPVAMAMNAPASIRDNISGMASAVAHPINTYNAITEAGVGGIVDMYAERYGSWSKAMRTIEEDPFGSALDAATIALPAQGAAMLPGRVGAVAAKVAKVGNAIDPIVMTAKAVKKTGHGIGYGAGQIVGLTTATSGDRAIRTAAEAGYKTALSGKTSQKLAKAIPGGVPADAAPGKAFLDYQVPPHRGGPDPFEIVYKAEGAFKKIVGDKNLKYTDDLAPVWADNTLHDLAPISKALDDALEIGGFDPKVPGLPALTDDLVNPHVAKMREIYDNFKKLDPKGKNRYRTMEGMDYLKRQFGHILDNLDQGTQAHMTVGRALDKVSETINNINPAYKTALQNYDKTRKAVRDLKQVFRLGKDMTDESAYRALVSVMRDTSHTAHGARALMMKALVENGATDIMYMIAGEHLSRVIKASIPSYGGGALAGAAVMSGVGFIKTALLLAMFSPKFMGKASYASGKIAGMVAKPLIAADKAGQFLARKYGRKAGIPDLPNVVTKRGVGLGAAQAGKVADDTEPQDMAPVWAEEISSRAEAKGYKIKKDVILRASALLASDNPDIYLMGIKMLGGNKRLMEIIKDIGAEAEQGE